MKSRPQLLSQEMRIGSQSWNLRVMLRCATPTKEVAERSGQAYLTEISRFSRSSVDEVSWATVTVPDTSSRDVSITGVSLSAFGVVTNSS